MAPTTVLTDMRRHPRAPLQLPARLRWHGPLGMRLESRETIDVSREGLLLRRGEYCQVGARVWVACPFDENASAGVQPETSARVMRVEREASGSFRVVCSLNCGEIRRLLATANDAALREFPSRCRFSCVPLELAGRRN